MISEVGEEVYDLAAVGEQTFVTERAGEHAHLTPTQSQMDDFEA